MSEVQSEQVEGAEPATPDGEPDGAPVDLPGPDVDGPADDDGEGDDGDDGEDGEEQRPQGDEEERQARARSEKEIEKRKGTLRKEELRHTNRIVEIMGEDAPDLIPCPVCMVEDGISGWVYPPDVVQPTEEQVSRIRQFAGLPDYSNLQQAPWAQRCPTCNGRGILKTDSEVGGAETTGCLDCNQRGWINTRSGAQNANGLTHPEGAIVTGPTVVGTEPDARVAALRAEGYTVIPQPQFATS